MSESKSIFTSKTAIFNFIAGVSCLIPVFGPFVSSIINAQFGTQISLENEFTTEQIQAMTGACFAFNIWLRKISDKPVHVLKAKS